jgi:hypothetical protein
MPLYLYYRPSFLRSAKRLGAEQRKIIAQILKCLIAYYTSDCNINKAKEINSGFFNKQLKRPYYEAGVGSNARIILIREKQKCIAILAGNHNQVRQFLRNL